MGRKLRERVQLPVPDLIEEFVEPLPLTRIFFCTDRAGIDRSQPHHGRDHKPTSHTRLLSDRLNAGLLQLLPTHGLVAQILETAVDVGNVGVARRGALEEE